MVLKVLIVDDDPMILHFVDLILSQQGYKVSSASSSETAMQILGREAFSLVLLDIRMPGMTGLDILRVLRTRAQRPKILMMTAQRDPGTIMQAIEQGAAGYLIKPFKPQDLIKRVEAILHPHTPRPAPAATTPPIDQVILD